MTRFTQVAHPVARLAAIALTAMLLGGCGDSVLEARETEFMLADPLQGRRGASPQAHLRWPEGTPLAVDKVTRAPMVVGAAIGRARAPIPVMSLLKVEVALLAPVDCADPPAWLLDARAFDFPALIEEPQLAELGMPVRTAEVWIVPGSSRGAYVDIPHAGAAARAIAMETQNSGDTPDDRSPFDAAFEFGPDWIGIPLRQAGSGRTVLFPPSQDCSAVARAQDDTLPTRVIAYGPFDQGSAADKYIRVPADTPFTARVLEACPATLKQRDELFEVRTGMIYRPPSREWRFTASVHGHCEGGVVDLAFGPLTARAAGEGGQGR